MRIKAGFGTSAFVLGAALLGPAAQRLATGPVTRISPPVYAMAQDQGPASPASAVGDKEPTARRSKTNGAKKKGTEKKDTKQESKEEEKPGRADGPWRASCNYWGPKHDSVAPEAVQVDTPCNEMEWGEIPVATAAAKRPVTALIATVPDPVHSSMAMDFDRMIDVITAAAGSNRYVLSHYWLPWRPPVANGRITAKAEKTEEAEGEKREHEPGLLILKPSNPACDLATDPASSRCDEAKTPRVIYLFLVAQTAALGVDRYELEKASQYQAILWKQGIANLSVRHPENEADVIGPNNSGAASSLRAGLDHAYPTAITTISIAGNTSTAQASEALNPCNSKRFRYISFSEDSVNEVQAISSMFNDPAFHRERLAFLTEAGTSFGAQVQRNLAQPETAPTPLPTRGQKEHPGSTAALPCTAANEDLANAALPARHESEGLFLQFPRGISLLRNAQREEKAPTDASSAAVEDADPYLHMSLKDDEVEDTPPHFARELSPYAQEAEWMAVVRELKDHHIETVAISASNVLDQLFLAKSLHRDLPDARPAFYTASDLLFVRSGDAAPYVGSVVATAYPLTALTEAGRSRSLKNFASFWTEAYYNAVSYTLWDGDPASLTLAGYTRADISDPILHPPPLWITTIGRDGYYPLGIVNPCNSLRATILPQIDTRDDAGHLHDSLPQECGNTLALIKNSLPASLGTRDAYPSFFWYVLCFFVSLLCVTHIVLLRVASFWSPATRDLAIEHSDEPHRRAVYIHIGTAMAFAMSAVTSIPALASASTLGYGASTRFVAFVTLGCGVAAVVATLERTRHFIRPLPPEERQDTDRCGYRDTRDDRRYLFSEARLYLFFNLTACLTAIALPLLWTALCTDFSAWDQERIYVGTFFSYRCLHPDSGVSPLLPVLLILAAWCLWAFFQTRRLRFSANSRPILPGVLEAPGLGTSLFVSDDGLGDCSEVYSSCLYENITCLLITHRLLWRVGSHKRRYFNALFLAVYLLCFTGFIFYAPIRGLDRYVRHNHLHLTPYEFLVSALFYPLLVIALTGALRMVMVWSSLRSGLLEGLERSPLRGAFSRLTNVSWMTMLRQSGMLEYWRDMTRSNQSMGQLLNSKDVREAAARGGEEAWAAAETTHVRLAEHVAELYAVVHAEKSVAWDTAGKFLAGKDLPLPEHRGALNLMCAIECDYATFCEVLLRCVLIPHWTLDRQELVESESPAEEKASHVLGVAATPIMLAEEFLALRYQSMIRAILINLRQLMTFVSVNFVLALIAWNSYPFQPRQWVDWAFTALLLGLGSVIVWVFAQMHRDPILSRITGTEANKLGVDFFIRLAVFGAAPVLTWMASQFPAIGSTISRLLQSGMAVAK